MLSPALKRLFHRRWAALTGAAGVVLSLAILGCGGSGGGADATSLVAQTFSSAHQVRSGNLQFAIKVNPSGSRTLSGPLALSFGGPFQSQGQGKLPASNFTITLSGFGRSGSLGLLSTGAAGYVSIGGTSYPLPVGTFRQLESGFSGLGAGAGGAGGLGRLGIDPRGWLVHPEVVGHEQVGGADTTHVTAGVDVGRLLADFNTVIQRAGRLGVKGATAVPAISPAQQAKISASVKNPKVDLWTGTSDRTLRRLAVTLTVPVTGQASALLGGLSSAGIELTLGYSAVNQPQTITAPSAVHPYSEFQAKIQALAGQLRGALGVGSAAGTGAAGSAGSSSGGAAAGGDAGSGAASSVSAYAQCIQSAASDVAKMQRCASLLGGK